MQSIAGATNEEFDAQREWDIDDAVRHNEAICALKLHGNPEALAYQKKCAKYLARVYQDGAPNIKSNKWKAKRFSLMAGLNTPAAKLSDTILKTANIYAAFGWFNDIRNFFTRILNIISAGNFARVGSYNNFLNTLGLLNIVRLVIDIGIVIKSVIFPEGEIEKNLPWWERFKAVLKKDGRPTRMATDAFWFTLSVVAICVSGGTMILGFVGVATLLAAAGLVFDIMMEMLSWDSVSRINKTISEIVPQRLAVENDPEFVDIQKNILLENNKLTSLQNEEKSSDNDSVAEIEARIARLKASPLLLQHEKFLLIEALLNNEISSERWAHARIFCSGVGLSVLWMVVPVTLALHGAILVFVVGSLICGLGERVIKSLSGKSEQVLDDAFVAEPCREDAILPNADLFFHRATANDAVSLAVDENSFAPQSSCSQDSSLSSYGFYAQHESVSDELNAHEPGLSVRQSFQ